MAETRGELDIWEAAVDFLGFAVNIFRFAQVCLGRREGAFWGEHYFAVFSGMIAMAVQETILGNRRSFVESEEFRRSLFGRRLRSCGFVLATL